MKKTYAWAASSRSEAAHLSAFGNVKKENGNNVYHARFLISKRTARARQRQHVAQPVPSHSTQKTSHSTVFQAHTQAKKWNNASDNQTNHSPQNTDDVGAQAVLKTNVQLRSATPASAASVPAHAGGGSCGALQRNVLNSSGVLRRVPATQSASTERTRPNVRGSSLNKGQN